jgi:hypothetical protein
MATLLKTKHFIFYGSPSQIQEELEKTLETFINSMEVNVIEMSHTYGVTNSGVPHISVLVAYSHIPVAEKKPVVTEEEKKILLDKDNVVKDNTSGLSKNTGAKNKNKK